MRQLFEATEQIALTGAAGKGGKHPLLSNL
jgi:hypothetical protein